MGSCETEAAMDACVKGDSCDSCERTGNRQEKTLIQADITFVEVIAAPNRVCFVSMHDCFVDAAERQFGRFYSRSARVRSLQVRDFEGNSVRSSGVLHG